MSVAFDKNEIEIIKNNYNQNKNVLLKLLPNRTWDTIRHKIERLELNRDKQRKNWTYENMKLFVEENNCKLITQSHEYTNIKSRIKVVCTCGNEYELTFDSFVNNNQRHCPECGKKIIGENSTYNYKEIKNYIDSPLGNRCKLIDTEEEFILKKNAVNVTGSNVLLNIQCKCGNKYITTFQDFKWSNKNKCEVCRTKEYKENISKKYNKEIKNNHLIQFNGKYIDSHTIINATCSCGESYQTTINSYRHGKIHCDECGKEIKRIKMLSTTEEYKEKVFNKVGDEYTVIGEYKNAKTKILMRHNCDNCDNYEWEITPASFLNNNTRCPKCGGKLRKSTDQFKQEVFNIVGNEYEVLGTYINDNTKIEIKHNLCGNIFLMTPGCFLGSKNRIGNRCPICAESKGEQVIRHYLEQNNFKFQSQYMFDDLLSDLNNPLRFDFGLIDVNNNLKLLIEYDGEQHFKWKKSWMSRAEFETLQYHDKLKNEYCKINNIRLIRIPYTKFNNIEEILYKELKSL